MAAVPSAPSDPSVASAPPAARPHPRRLRLLPGLVGAALCLALAAATGCGDPPERYEVRGRVVGVSGDGTLLTVDHEEIPGWMEAMQMTLPLRSPEAARDLEPGTVIRFVLHVENGRSSVDEIEVLPPDTPLSLMGSAGGESGSHGGP